MRKNKLLSYILVIFIFCAIFSVNVFAENGEDKGDLNVVNEISSGITDPTTKTVKDSSGNEFYLYGFPYVLGSYAYSTTNFYTTYYIGGTKKAKEELDAQEKSLTSGGKVYMSGGASTSFSNSCSLTGQTNTLTTKSGSLLYSVTSITGNHVFSFNGAYASFYSYF